MLCFAAVCTAEVNVVEKLAE
ncbi:MAG: hypothetical protein RLZZ476_851, partial [Verrucomicrobiota bacterium]